MSRSAELDKIKQQIKALTKQLASAQKPPEALEQEIDWEKVKHTCPKCGHKGTVAQSFGTRVVRGVERKQSWCINCRATTNYHASPRKNHTKVTT